MRIVTLLCLLGLSALLVQAQTGRDLSTDGRVLTGVEWRVVSFGPAGNEANVIAGTTLSLRFVEDRSVSGSAGCNMFRGTYEVRGDTLTLGRMVSTKRACLDQRANQQEQRYLGALESANRFRIVSKRLTIFYSNGRNVINLVDANDSSPSPDGAQPAESDPVAALISYYNAINERNYQQAYRMWETPETNLERFSRGFADTRRVRLLIEPPVRVEGAAGSAFAEIPTILIAETSNGRERFFAGCYVLRRSNELRGPWRIYRARINQVSASAALQQPISQTCTR